MLTNGNLTNTFHIQGYHFNDSFVFYSAKDLKNHLSIHTGERPHQCQFCDRKFIDNANCRKHKLKDHPDELAKYEAVHGRRRGTYASYAAMNQAILNQL